MQTLPSILQFSHVVGLVATRRGFSRLSPHLVGSPSITSQIPSHPPRGAREIYLRARFLAPLRPCPLDPRRHSGIRVEARQMSWTKLNLGTDQFDDGPSDGQEEAAKTALLEKAMKGRQPTDLMLRCELMVRVVCVQHWLNLN